MIYLNDPQNCSWQDLLPNIPDESIDLVIIDPPYLTTNMGWDSEEQVNSILAKHLFRILKSNGSFYCWCGIGEKSDSFSRWKPLFSEFFTFKDIITWVKFRGIGMRKGWLYTREEIMWFVKDNKQFRWNTDFQYSTERRKRDGGKDEIKPSQTGQYAKSLYKRITNIWADIPEVTYNISEKIGHYTPKPLEALNRIIQVHTDIGDIVLDCFCGLGSTALASKKLERNFIVCDNDPKAIEVTKERLK